MTQGNIKGTGIGVAVDADAVRLHEPVTVLLSPAGNRWEADDWSHANNLKARGYEIAPGYPIGPSGELAPDPDRQQSPELTPAADQSPAPAVEEQATDQGPAVATAVEAPTPRGRPRPSAPQAGDA